tara:strand:+ start:2062 stop:2316 length:255 start_codon:yes stop_codon:yes gene_type:complete
MSTYTQYTGIFRKKNGINRLMNFIKVLDLPKHLVSDKMRENHLSYDGKQEIVYDVNAGGFRRFNHGTAVGQITSKYIKKEFDKS